VVDCGIDWVTVTATNKTSTLKLLEYGRKAIRSEREQGNEKRDFWFKGYEGWKCGSVSVGARADGGIFIASGGLAREHWRGAFEAGTNCSRIDYQVTARVPGNTQEHIMKCYNLALAKTKKLKRGPTVDIHHSSRGSSTCYLGSRSSEKFGRIYDKGAESSLDVMQGCVRYELELKGDTAFAQIKQLATSRVVQDAIAGKVQKFIRDRLGVSSFARVNVETLVCPPRACDQLRSLEWIQVSVSPTIKRLIESGHAVALFDCLHVEKLLQALRDRDTLNTLDRKLSEVA
jgi:hypothetical protein